MTTPSKYVSGPILDCEACMTPDACAIRGQCAHYLREREAPQAVSTPAQPAQALMPFSPAQRRRLWNNSPEHQADAKSMAGFERIVTLTERAHGITATPTLDAMESAAQPAQQGEAVDAAKRLRDRFDAHYGETASVMRAALAWRSKWADWQRPCNMQMERPVLEADVDAAECRLLEAIRAAMPPTPPAPPAVEPAEARDAELLDFLVAEYLTLEPFSMSDDDVGWRTIQHHQGKPSLRVASEVYADDPRQAIREAQARLLRDPYCTGPLHVDDAPTLSASAGAQSA